MEQWKEIVNFEGIYEVSSLGQVRRIHKDNRSSKYMEDIGEISILNLLNVLE